MPGRDKVAQLPGECRELGDAVGAETVDSDRVQCFPLGGVIRGPRDHSGPNRVRTLDGLFVDRVDFLPQISGGHGDQGGRRVYMPGNL